MAKINKSKIYQQELAKMYENMENLVKKGQLPANWQADREAVRTLKKAAKKSTKNVIDKLEGRDPVASYIQHKNPELYKEIVKIRQSKKGGDSDRDQKGKE